MHIYMFTRVYFDVEYYTENSPNKKKVPLKFYALLSCSIYIVIFLQFFFSFDNFNF